MEVIVVIVILGVLGGVLFLVFRKKKQIKESQKWRQSPDDRAWDIMNTVASVRTPANHELYFENGTSPSTFDAVAFDFGVEQNWKDFECSNYPVNRAQHRVKGVIFQSEPDSQGDPCYRIHIGHNNPYYNSEWDKLQGKGIEFDHYILAAGQMISAGEPKGDTIIIPHHNTTQSPHLSTIVQYEMQHIGYAWYDGDKFEATKIHGSGSGHPIIPACATAARLKAARPFRGICLDAKK